MNLQEILTLIEARRNPKQNVKISGHEEAVKFLHSRWVTTENDNGYGVSMTELPKLGINPASTYNTPVGVYFYPANYYLDMKSDDLELDFQDGADYIQIFKYNSDDASILSISDVDVGMYHKFQQKLFSNVSSIATLLNASEKNTTSNLAYIMTHAGDESLHKSYGGQLWYILFALSKSHENSFNDRKNMAKRSATIWNSLFRLIGVDIVLDNGSGIIHTNEQTQGVVLNPRTIQLIKTIKNITPMHPEISQSISNHIKNTKKTPKPINNKMIGAKLYSVTIQYYSVDDLKQMTALENEAKVYAHNENDATDLVVKHLGIAGSQLYQIEVKDVTKKYSNKSFLVTLDYYNKNVADIKLAKIQTVTFKISSTDSWEGAALKAKALFASGIDFNKQYNLVAQKVTPLK